MSDALLRRFPTLGLAALWTALYVLGIGYSDAFVIGPSHVTLFWPAAGVAFALVGGAGLRWAAVIPVAVLIAHLTITQVPAAFVPFSVASNLAGALAGATLAGRLRGTAFDSAGSLFGFAAGATVMATVAAAIGTFGLVVAGMVPVAAAGTAYTKWALGDLLGIVCIAPTLLLLTRRAADVDAPPTTDYAGAGEKAAWVLVYATAYAFVYWVGRQNSGYALGMVAFPLALLLWSAFRFGRLWTAVGTMTAVFVVTSLTGLGLAAFQAPKTLLDVVLLLGFLNLFAVLPLLLMASIHHQRVGARRALRLAAVEADRQQAELERLVAERTRQLDDVNRQLEHASQTDALTGLRNRRYIAQQLPLDLGFYSREASEAHTPPHALFFALVDIDHFKHINDTLGHKAGDAVLQQFAQVLGGLVRGSDYAVRWGGEEFLLVLRPMPSEHVATLGERICRSIAAHRFCVDGAPPLKVTCSVGFAELDLLEQQAPVTWEQIVEVADAALYWVKHNGRDGWAVLRPAPGTDLAALAARTGEGAQALHDAGGARLVTHLRQVPQALAS
ncbi:sensor domain-containing diguanylate cyclase [Lysobacter humi (ex Lee et al. 2017)]